MSKLILITKKDCKKCEWIKDRIDREELPVEIMDAESTNGIAHLTYHELYNTGEVINMPVLIIDDDNVLKGETINMLKALRIRKEESQSI